MRVVKLVDETDVLMVVQMVCGLVEKWVALMVGLMVG